MRVNTKTTVITGLMLALLACLGHGRRCSSTGVAEHGVVRGSTNFTANDAGH